MTETVTSTKPLVVAPGETKPGFAGTNVPRKEDKRLVQGEGLFFDDVKRHNMGYVHFVRSPYAHAKIRSVDVSKALEHPGVFGTLTGDEVALLTDPFFQISSPPGAHLKDFCLAVGRARFVGEPVAAVAASTHEYVLAQAPEYRPGLAGLDAMRVEEDLYRACVPGPDPKRWLCLFVTTDQSPPGVTADPDRAPNAAYRMHGGFR